MGLPKIDAAVFELTLPFQQKEIKFRPYFIAEEKAIVTAMVDEKKKDVINNLIATAKECILESEVPIGDDWKTIDFLYYAMLLRAKSKGEMMTLTQECKHCKSKYQFDTNIEESIKILNKENYTQLVEVTEKLSLEIEPVGLEYIKSLDKINPDDPSMEQSYDVVLGNIAKTVTKVIIDGKIYPKKDFTEKELFDNVLYRLSESQIGLILEKKEQLMKLALIISSKCKNLKCEKENSVEIEDFFAYII